jgi:hypothetical protein
MIIGRNDANRQWEQYATWQQAVLVLTTWPFVLGLRALWQYYPEVWACALFWAFSLADEPLRWRFLGVRRRLCYSMATMGAIGNAVATLANGGVMPVAGLKEQRSLWVPLTSDHRFQWLCDVHPGGFSLGDYFILSALALLLIIWLAERASLLDEESIAYGRKVPGVGIG